MYIVQSKDNFFLDKITHLLNLFDIPITNPSMKSYGIIYLDYNNNKIDLNFNSYKKSFSCPVRVIDIVKELKLILTNHSIEFDSLVYYPLKQIISKEDKSIQLRHIHNIIIEEILKNPNHEMSKEYLYKCIWPEDHDMQLNKLDTHLTNLKNLLKESLSFNFSFRSISGKIKFLI